MMKLPKKSNNVKYWITLSVSFIGTVACAIVLSNIDSRLSSEGLGVVYLQLAFTPFNFRAVLLSWGREGVELFLSTLWIDFIFPLMYSLLLASTAAIAAQGKTARSNSSLQKAIAFACVAPFAAAAFDYIENILHLVIITNRLYSKILIAAASVSASLKFIILISVVLLLLLLSLPAIRTKSDLKE